jgi:hypothetical protein
MRYLIGGADPPGGIRSSLEVSASAVAIGHLLARIRLYGSNPARWD